MAKPSPHFADAAKRLDHFQRHGTALGHSTPKQYERSAARFLTALLTADIYEKTKSNGDRVRYNQTTQEFGVVTRLGIIRTYFIPDPKVHGFPTNLDYYHAQ